MVSCYDMSKFNSLAFRARIISLEIITKTCDENLLNKIAGNEFYTIDMVSCFGTSKLNSLALRARLVSLEIIT